MLFLPRFLMEWGEAETGVVRLGIGNEMVKEVGRELAWQIDGWWVEGGMTT